MKVNEFWLISQATYSEHDKNDLNCVKGTFLYGYLYNTEEISGNV